MPKQQQPELPQNIEAEQFVISCMLHDDQSIIKAHELLHPSDFLRSIRAQAFRAMFVMLEKRIEINPITLAEEMKKLGADTELCDVKYFSSMFTLRFNMDFSVQGFEDYLRIVKEKSTLRKLLMFGRQIVTMAQHSDTDPEKALAFAMDGVLEMQDKKSSGLVANSDILMTAWEQISAWVRDGGRKMVLCLDCGARALSGEGARRYSKIKRVPGPEDIEWTGEPKPYIILPQAETAELTAA